MPAVNSCISLARLHHARLGPVAHAFTYPSVVMTIDLDDLPRLDRVSRLFGVNRRRLLSLYDRDYGWPADPAPIRDKARALLAEGGATGAIERIILVTTPRLLGYAFNPVSFYYGMSSEGEVVAAAAEVNNTFGERHFYVLKDGTPVAGRNGTRFRAEKVFHVSPFFSRDGEYTFELGHPGEWLDIRITLEREGRRVFQAALSGRQNPITPAALRATLARAPFTILLTVPRILFQAAKLTFARKLPVHTKPLPQSVMTCQAARPSLAQSLSLAFVTRFLRRLEHGRLQMTLPDGTTREFVGRQGGPEGLIRVKDYAFFTSVVRGGDVGFGEAYTDGLWESPDPSMVVRLFIANASLYDDPLFRLPLPGRLMDRLRHAWRTSTPRRARANIQEHYDLGDHLYERFLDSSMTYSCAIFADRDDTLEAAQRRKIHAMIEKADLKAGDHVLEIGSGWGSFAMEAARSVGCRVTTLTLSDNQFAAVQQRVKAAGLESLVEPRLCDFRRAGGQYDKIVSIEMLEAVGHANLGNYFAKLDGLLKPLGRAAIQVITYPDQQYDRYRRGCDWIQKHIFPGGHLPSVSAMADAMRTRSRFVIDSLEDIGFHYARTLREWLDRFHASEPELRRMGVSEKFIRTWEYYFHYCESAFESRSLGVVQMVLRRPSEAALLTTPWSVTPHDAAAARSAPSPAPNPPR